MLKQSLTLSLVVYLCAVVFMCRSISILLCGLKYEGIASSWKAAVSRGEQCSSVSPLQEVSSSALGSKSGRVDTWLPNHCKAVAPPLVAGGHSAMGLVTFGGLCDVPVGFGSAPLCQTCLCAGRAGSYSMTPIYSFCSASCEHPPCHRYGTNWLSFPPGLVLFWHSQPGSFLLEGCWLTPLILTPPLDPAHVGVGRWSVCNCHHHPPHPGDKDLAVLSGVVCQASLQHPLQPIPEISDMGLT